MVWGELPVYFSDRAVSLHLQLLLHCSCFFILAYVAAQPWAKLVGCSFLPSSYSLSLCFDIAKVVCGRLGWAPCVFPDHTF